MTSLYNRNGDTIQLCPNIHLIYSMHAYICMPFDAHINCIIYMEYHRVLYHLLTQLNRNTSCHKYILVASTILYHHCNTPTLYAISILATMN